MNINTYLRNNPVKLTYGAPLGRAGRVPGQPVPDVRLQEVRLDAGGYAPDGTYWGLNLSGQRLYCAMTQDTDGLGPLVEVYLRAPNRRWAKKKLSDMYPSLQFSK